jgi:hypothetical protein
MTSYPSPAFSLSHTHTQVPYKNSENLLKFVPHCKLHAFEGESHMFFMKSSYHKPVSDIISDFVLAV